MLIFVKRVTDDVCSPISDLVEGNITIPCWLDNEVNMAMEQGEKYVQAGMYLAKISGDLYLQLIGKLSVLLAQVNDALNIVNNINPARSLTLDQFMANNSYTIQYAGDSFLTLNDDYEYEFTEFDINQFMLDEYDEDDYLDY